MKKSLIISSFLAFLMCVTVAHADVFSTQGGLFTQGGTGGGGGSGDFVGPSSSTDNAAVRFDGTTGKLGQNSGVIIDDSNNVSGVGTLASGAHTITSSSSNCLALGPNGSTNPTLSADCSVSNAATGLRITSQAAGGNIGLSATSSGADASFGISAKGAGRFNVAANNFTLSDDRLNTTFSGSGSGGTVWGFSFGGNSGSAAANDPIIDFKLANTRTFNTGNFALQQNIKVRQSGLNSVAASTITMAATLSIDGAPLAGGNLTFTNAAALHLPTVALTNTTNGYGIYSAAPTGATNNYAAYFGGPVQQIGKTLYDATNTASGTTGAQTINKPSGSVNLAAASTSLVVTNSLVTATSLVFCTLATNDAMANFVKCVPSAGSFMIIPDNAPDAEAKVAFLVIN